MTRIYSTFDPDAIGPGLLLDSSLLRITTSLSSLDNHRKALCRIPKAVGTGTFEAYFWSDSQAAYTDELAIGVATPDSPLDEAVGEDSLSYGWYPGNGEYKNNGSVVQTFDTATERNCIGVLGTIDGAGGLLRFFCNGNWIGNASLPAGKLWVPAVTISGGDAGDWKCELNLSGPFAYPYVIIA